MGERDPRFKDLCNSQAIIVSAKHCHNLESGFNDERDEELLQFWQTVRVYRVGCKVRGDSRDFAIFTSMGMHWGWWAQAQRVFGQSFIRGV